MPSLSDVLKFRAFMYEKSTELIRRKGADYNRDQQVAGDTLFNLKVCEILGIVPSAEEGILVRLSDKFMRLISLTKPGREAEVKDESVLDTIADIANYTDYLGLLWLERRQKNSLGLGSGLPKIPSVLQPTSGGITGGSAGKSLSATPEGCQSVRGADSLIGGHSSLITSTEEERSKRESYAGAVGPSTTSSRNMGFQRDTKSSVPTATGSNATRTGNGEGDPSPKPNVFEPGAYDGHW